MLTKVHCQNVNNRAMPECRLRNNVRMSTTEQCQNVDFKSNARMLTTEQCQNVDYRAMPECRLQSNARMSTEEQC